MYKKATVLYDLLIVGSILHAYWLTWEIKFYRFCKYILSWSYSTFIFYSHIWNRFEFDICQKQTVGNQSQKYLNYILRLCSCEFYSKLKRCKSTAFMRSFWIQPYLNPHENVVIIANWFATFFQSVFSPLSLEEFSDDGCHYGNLNLSEIIDDIVKKAIKIYSSTMAKVGTH